MYTACFGLISHLQVYKLLSLCRSCKAAATAADTFLVGTVLQRFSLFFLCVAVSDVFVCCSRCTLLRGKPSYGTLHWKHILFFGLRQDGGFSYVIARCHDVAIEPTSAIQPFLL
jgi:hypothetical protein